ncbi:hypothetical protein GN958_ATG10378 [Phytophthora infestans]|uniref:Uncharacterized protein n=1 Tax=Phytophthora infestans TaxID=4787 RepID=A0A8S9UHX3_PHYIN|nr:hypothetical protein GN958_ATG10378 [Phytophthora infestans]
MMKQDANSLRGAWESNEAFGNTALDWSQALKDQHARLQLTFEPANEGSYELEGDDGIVIHGDTSGIKWTYLFEEEESLRIRLEGAKRFGRCKGVDVIYFARAQSKEQLKDL